MLVRRCVLFIACSMVLVIPGRGQVKTTDTLRHITLDEVTALGDAGENVLPGSLRMITVIPVAKAVPSSVRSFDDLLDYYPFADIRTRGTHGIQSDLSIRGGSFDQSLVLLNGFNMNDPQTGHFNLHIPVSVNQADRIEVLTGPSTREFGVNAYSGAVNVITSPSDSLHAAASAAYGTYGLLDASLRVDVPTGPFTTLLALSRASSDGYRENTDFINSGMYLHSVLKLNKISGDIMAGTNEKRFGANAFYTPRFPEQYEETALRFGAIRVKSTGQGPLIQGQVHWRSHKDHFMLFRQQPEVYENFHLTRVVDGKFSVRVNSKGGLTSIAAGYRHEGIRSTTLGMPAEHPVLVPETDSTYYGMISSRNLVTMTLNHRIESGRYRLAAGVLIQTGLDMGLQPGIYPGADFSVILGESGRLFLSANRSMRLPTFTDLYYEGPQNRGNPDLVPETAVTVESGYVRGSPFWQGRIAVFYRRGEETIDWIREEEIWQTRNITRLNTYGGDVMMTAFPGKLSRHPLSPEIVSISYGYTGISKEAGAFVSNYALDNLRHKVVFELHQDLWERLYLDIKTSWHDRNGTFSFFETPDSSPVERAYDPFWVTDVSIGLKYKSFRLFLNIRNLLDEEYRDIGSVIMPGRWISAGITAG